MVFFCHLYKERALNFFERRGDSWFISINYIEVFVVCSLISPSDIHLMCNFDGIPLTVVQYKSLLTHDTFNFQFFPVTSEIIKI